MKTDDAILDDIIREGKVDIDSWPSLLNRLLVRFDHIVHDVFTPATLPDSSADSGLITSTEDPSKSEDDKPSLGTGPTINDSTAIPNHANSTSTPSPSEDTATITSLKEILSTSFSTYPPHTVQRLAELLRNPTQHYHSLTKYLRAMQRVLSVSSALSHFPLPLPVDLPPEGSVSIGGFASIPLGSDESLGGALLTPISWLKPDAESDEEIKATMPNGVGVGVVREASPDLDHDMGIGNVQSHDEKMLEVRAQGPPVLGPEDIGPQPEGLILPDITDVMSPRSPSSPSRQLRTEHSSGEKKAGEKENTDVVMSNVENDGPGEQVEGGPETTSEKNEDKMDVDPKGDDMTGGGRDNTTATTTSVATVTTSASLPLPSSSTLEVTDATEHSQETKDSG